MLAAAAVALVVPGLAGMVVAACTGLLGPRALGRLAPPADRADADAVAAGLPLALDLLAACLAGGAGLEGAAAAVGAAVADPCGNRFRRVAGALALGAPAAEAWLLLAAPGSEVGVGFRRGTGPDSTSPARAAARALARAGEGGAPVAASVRRIAATARAEAAAHSRRRARHAGVLAVLPLGLCFLPAFVLVGVVPAVAGLAGPVLAGL